MAEDGVQLEIMNWDDECYKDFLCGNGIKITEQPFVKEEKTLHGSHSPKFQTDWNDEDAFADRYSCQCKKLKGRIYVEECCKDCGTRVTFRDVNLSQFGWIQIKRFKIIQPAYYRMLKSFLGDVILNDIINLKKTFTRDGQLEDIPDNKNPFKGIGLDAFCDRFEEILIFFKDKKRDKEDLYTKLIYNKPAVFASNIPIYAPVLRPVTFKGESLFYNPVDRKYNYILSLVILLNKKVQGDDLSSYKKKRQRLDIPTILYRIQKKVIELFDTIFMEINQKDGHIKESILGGRLSFTSRCGVPINTTQRPILI